MSEVRFDQASSRVPAVSWLVFGAGVLLGLVSLLLWYVEILPEGPCTVGDCARVLWEERAASGTFVRLPLFPLLLLAIWRRSVPWYAWVGALLLVLGSCTMTAETHIKREDTGTYWAYMVPWIGTPYLVGLCAVALWPFRPRKRARIASAVLTWGVLALIVVSMPFGGRHALDVVKARARVTTDTEVDRLAQAFSDLADAPDGAPLWVWLDRVPKHNLPYDVEIRLVGRIRPARRHQADAEVMMDRGDFPLRYLDLLHLEATPSLCARARALLVRRADALMPDVGKTPSIFRAASDIWGARQAMIWLYAHGCPCDVEKAAWIGLAQSFLSIDNHVDFNPNPVSPDAVRVRVDQEVRSLRNIEPPR